MSSSSAKILTLIGVLCVLTWACQPSQPVIERTSLNDITVCGPSPIAVTYSLASYASPSPKVFINHPRYLAAGEPHALPVIIANENTETGGELSNNTLAIDLQVAWGALYPEDDEHPGLKVVAFGEIGDAPSIPGPMIRVEEGTLIKASIKNTIPDSTLTIYGLQSRPSEVLDSLVIAPGETGSVSFQAGVQGTYFYWAKVGKGVRMRMEEEEQLAGAFIVDAKGEKPDDRVMVVNIFSSRIDQEQHEWGSLEALMINGKSWPYTENIEMSVGEKQHWKIVNVSQRHHPMHLHGFYYDVLSNGEALEDNIHPEDETRSVVTETMEPFTTMSIEWTPTRPGKWLYHCHLSFHVTHDLRLPGAHEADNSLTQQHMAGLVMGLTVKAGPSDLISKGEERNITLYAKTFDPVAGHAYGVNEDPDYQADSIKAPLTGQPLILKQYQTTNVTVVNRLPEPTSIHWHGLELDAWSDGVPGYSSSDGKTSPIIEPGDSFTYKLSLMNSGTFVYHSHLNDIFQLSKGLFGPMIVIGEGEEYNPEVDHFYTFGFPFGNFGQMEINSSQNIPNQIAEVNQEHRIRLINIAVAGLVKVYMTKDGEAVKLMSLAKDGAELPRTLQTEVSESPFYGNGETADFTFSAKEPGEYQLIFDIGFDKLIQTWVVK